MSRAIAVDLKPLSFSARHARPTGLSEIEHMGCMNIHLKFI